MFRKLFVVVMMVIACAQYAHAMTMAEAYAESRRLFGGQNDLRATQQTVNTKVTEVVETTKTVMNQRNQALDQRDEEKKKRLEAERKQAEEEVKRKAAANLANAYKKQMEDERAGRTTTPVATTTLPPTQPTQPQTIRLEVVQVPATTTPVAIFNPSSPAPTSIHPVPKDGRGNPMWTLPSNPHMVWSENTGEYVNSRLAEIQALEKQNPKELKDGKVKWYNKNRDAYIIPRDSQVYAPGDGPFAGSGHNTPISGGSSTGASLSMGWGTRGQ